MLKLYLENGIKIKSKMSLDDFYKEYNNDDYTCLRFFRVDDTVNYESEIECIVPKLAITMIDILP